ncbi:hypothetical protein GCM10028795_18360 [Lysobacter olei]
MVRASHATEHGMEVALFDMRVGRHRQRLPSDQLQQMPFEEDRITCAQHRHPADRAPVDVHATRAFAQLEPDATAIDAELHARICAALHRLRPAVGVKANGMHARCQYQVKVVTMRESESGRGHVRGI